MIKRLLESINTSLRIAYIDLRYADFDAYICRALRLQCYATAVEFDRKSKCLKILLTLKNVVDVLLPVLVFASLSFLQVIGLKFILWGVGFIGAIQVIMTTIALIFKWEEDYHYFIESKLANFALAEEFDAMYNNRTNTNYVSRFRETMLKYQMRNEQDYKYFISDRLKLIGKRAAYSKYDEVCPICDTNSNREHKTHCPNCGLRRIP